MTLVAPYRIGSPRGTSVRSTDVSTRPDRSFDRIESQTRRGPFPATSRGAALHYARKGWPVFPCQWTGGLRKAPLTGHGFYDATTDAPTIREWWDRWPKALIGIPTGAPIGAVVLDIDVKDWGANGFDTLNDLGLAVLPETPIEVDPDRETAGAVL
jgi:hypothetical protein